MLQFGLIIGFLLGYILITVIRRRRPKVAPTHVEYWVYLPEEKLPKMEDLMTDLTKAEALGSAEMLLFSDIRLHVVLVLRSKNPVQFRPDLFDVHVEPTPESLQMLGNAQALARIRFLSEGSTKDDRHLRLMPYLAFAAARRGNSTLLFDVVTERLLTLEEFGNLIKKDRKLAKATFHTRVVWQPLETGGQAETRGMAKKGWPELRTLPVREDQRVLITEVLEQTIEALWAEKTLPSHFKVKAYEDEFEILFGEASEGWLPVRVMRIHET